MNLFVVDPDQNLLDITFLPGAELLMLLETAYFDALPVILWCFWLLYLLTLGTVGVLRFLRSIRWNRHLENARCPSCGHLRGPTPRTHCPECSFPTSQCASKMGLARIGRPKRIMISVILVALTAIFVGTVEGLSRGATGFGIMPMRAQVAWEACDALGLMRFPMARSYRLRLQTELHHLSLAGAQKATDFKALRIEDACHLLATPNGKRLFVVTESNIFLLAWPSCKVINRVERVSPMAQILGAPVLSEGGVSITIREHEELLTFWRSTENSTEQVHLGADVIAVGLSERTGRLICIRRDLQTSGRYVVEDGRLMNWNARSKVTIELAVEPWKTLVGLAERNLVILDTAEKALELKLESQEEQSLLPEFYKVRWLTDGGLEGTLACLVMDIRTMNWRIVIVDVTSRVVVRSLICPNAVGVIGPMGSSDGEWIAAVGFREIDRCDTVYYGRTRPKE